MLRTDKLLMGCQRYIGESLGGAFTQAQPWTLEGVLPDTTALRPIIFILTSGADPTAMLQVPLPFSSSALASVVPNATCFEQTECKAGVCNEAKSQQRICTCRVCPVCLFLVLVVETNASLQRLCIQFIPCRTNRSNILFGGFIIQKAGNPSPLKAHIRSHLLPEGTGSCPYICRMTERAKGICAAEAAFW